MAGHPSDKNKNDDKMWTHAGGKLRELGADKLSDVELLSIIIAPGIKGRSAERIAQDTLTKFSSFRGMSGQPLEKFLQIKGLSDVKIIRIAAVLEIAKRSVHTVLKELKDDPELREEVFGK